MTRREFITLLGGAAAWPLAANAQQGGGSLRRIAILTGYAENDAESQSRLKAFREGLRVLGWSEGSNIRIDARFAGGESDRVRTLAAELVATSPEVILCSGSPVTMALQQATRTIPIVSVLLTDPLGTGLVPSLARPAGNITGFVNYEFALGGKWLDLLREVATNVNSVLIVWNSNSAGSLGLLRVIEQAASSAGIQTTSLDVRNKPDIDGAISAFAERPNGGLVAVPDPAVSLLRERLIALSTRHRLPAIYPFRFFAADGGLIAYGVDTGDLFRRSASYVDRILKGANPADLPLQQPIKFELVINLKTAKALGLDVPPTLLARADEVIE